MFFGLVKHSDPTLSNNNNSSNKPAIYRFEQSELPASIITCRIYIVVIMRKSSACSILFGLFVWEGTFHSVESFVGPGRRHPTVCSSWTATRSSAPRTLAAAAEADAEAASDVSIPYDAAARLAFEALGDDTLAFEDYIKTYKAEAIEFVKSKGFFASSSSSSPSSSSSSVDAVTDASASSDSSATATTAPTTITIQEEQKRMR